MLKQWKDKLNISNLKYVHVHMRYLCPFLMLTTNKIFPCNEMMVQESQMLQMIHDSMRKYEHAKRV
jgi:hypothetical protein